MLASPPSSATRESAVAAAAEAMRPTVQPSRTAQLKTPTKLVNHRERFSLLIVRGDGARIARISFPRRLPTTLLVVFVVGVVALGTLVGDWWYLRQRVRAAATLFQQNDEQRATIEAFNRRVTELRREVTGWRELHARVWEAFGPELAPRSRDAGIGGSSATLLERPARSSAVAELDLLTEQIQEEGHSLKALDRLIGKARRALLALPSRWPVRGGVNSEFGRRLSPWTKVEELHGGLDINASQGTPVRAPAGGTVVFAGSNADYGITVVLDHGQEIRTLYGHLSKLMVQYGQKVERGHVVGLSGNTGRSSGPHLHYEIVVKGQSVNPRAYLWD